MSKEALLNHYANNQLDVQIKFKEDPGPPVGPGKVEIVKISGVHVDETYYKHTAPALMAGPGNTPVQIMLPIIFCPEDVLWVTEGPLNADEESLIAVPGGGKRTAGGLHIG